MGLQSLCAVQDGKGATRPCTTPAGRGGCASCSTCLRRVRAPKAPLPLHVMREGPLCSAPWCMPPGCVNLQALPCICKHMQCASAAVGRRCAGAQVDAATTLGRATSLHRAAYTGRGDVVQALCASRQGALLIHQIRLGGHVRCHICHLIHAAHAAGAGRAFALRCARL